MMNKFKNKYRIKSHRMPGWDYSGNGYYFITLVTQNRMCNLGNVVNGKMILSDFGCIVNTEWKKSFEIRNELFLDTYIIMPNHIHAIVVIDKSNIGDDTYGLDKLHDTHNTHDTHDTHGTHGTHGTHVETHGRASLQSQSSQSSQSSQPKLYRPPKSLSSFIGGFKSVVNSKIDDFIDENKLDITKYNRNNHFFQPNYHDHIIRNENEYLRILKYIINNPQKWEDDKLNGGNGNIVMEPSAEYNSEIWMI